MMAERPRARRILVAEDEASILVSLEFLLAQAGYEVHTAADGEETLRALHAMRPDLVLLDLMLPVVDGFEICRRLRADPDLAATRIVVLTAKGGSSEIARGWALGVDAYVTKPFATRELLDTLRRILGQ